MYKPLLYTRNPPAILAVPTMAGPTGLTFNSLYANIDCHTVPIFNNATSLVVCSTSALVNPNYLQMMGTLWYRPQFELT